MRVIELIGLFFITTILVAIVIPIPCLPASCGPEGAELLTFFETVLVYIYQPLTWVIIISWIFAITL